MNLRGDPDVILAAWLDDGPTELPSATRRAISIAVRTTPQARASLGLPARRPLMSRIPALAGAAALIAAGVGLFAIGMPKSPGVVGGVAVSTPTSSPGMTPSVAPPSSTPTAPIDASGWTPFVSARYGFKLGVPPGWMIAPADHDWTWEGDATNWRSTGADRFMAPGNTILVSAWTVPLQAGQTFDRWADVETWAQAYCQRTGNTDCASIHDRVVPMCIENRDCHPALVIPFRDDVQAFGTGGILPEGMLVVAVWRGESDPSTAPYGGSQRLLDSFLSTLGIFPPVYPESQDAAASFAATGH